MALTKKRKVFVEEYLKCWNATEAARRAGYKHPNVQGPTLLIFPDIQTRVENRLNDLKVNSAEIPNTVLRRQRDKAKFVYLIKEQYGLIKIGQTNNIANRLCALDTICPYSLSLIGFIETQRASRLEADLHKRFADKRVKGEWFALSDDDIKEILDEWDSHTKGINS